MYIYINMSIKKIEKIIISVDGPILPGSISSVRSRCNNRECACYSKKSAMHGPYYRWTGFIDGKRTTKNISALVARECTRRIKNYRKLQHQLERMLKDAFHSAPWEEND